MPGEDPGEGTTPHGKGHRWAWDGVHHADVGEPGGVGCERVPTSGGAGREPGAAAVRQTNKEGGS